MGNKIDYSIDSVNFEPNACVDLVQEKVHQTATSGTCVLTAEVSDRADSKKSATKINFVYDGQNIFIAPADQQNAIEFGIDLATNPKLASDLLGIVVNYRQQLNAYAFKFKTNLLDDESKLKPNIGKDIQKLLEAFDKANNDGTVSSLDSKTKIFGFLYPIVEFISIADTEHDLSPKREKLLRGLFTKIFSDLSESERDSLTVLLRSFIGDGKNASLVKPRTRSRIEILYQSIQAYQKLTTCLHQEKIGGGHQKAILDLFERYLIYVNTGLAKSGENPADQFHHILLQSDLDNEVRNFKKDFLNKPDLFKVFSDHLAPLSQLDYFKITNGSASRRLKGTLEYFNTAVEENRTQLIALPPNEAFKANFEFRFRTRVDQLVGKLTQLSQAKDLKKSGKLLQEIDLPQELVSAINGNSKWIFQTKDGKQHLDHILKIILPHINLEIKPGIPPVVKVDVAKIEKALQEKNKIFINHNRELYIWFAAFSYLLFKGFSQKQTHILGWYENGIKKINIELVGLPNPDEAHKAYINALRTIQNSTSKVARDIKIVGGTVSGAGAILMAVAGYFAAKNKDNVSIGLGTAGANLAFAGATGMICDKAFFSKSPNQPTYDALCGLLGGAIGTATGFAAFTGINAAVGEPQKPKIIKIDPGSKGTMFFKVNIPF